MTGGRSVPGIRHPSAAAAAARAQAPGPDGPVLGHVDGRPVPSARLERRIVALYQGNRAAALPSAGTREGRQLRRWAAQVLLTEELLAVEARRRGLDPAPAALVDLDPLGRVELGSVDSAALGSPWARAVYLDVTAGAAVSDAEVEVYARRHRDDYPTPERRRVRYLLLDAPTADPGALESGAADEMEVGRGELPRAVEEAVFGPGSGARPVLVRDDLGWHLLRVVAVRPAVRPDAERVRALAAAELAPGSRRRHFRRWLDGRRAESITVAPGFEHPADPRQPDHVHQH